MTKNKFKNKNLIFFIVSDGMKSFNNFLKIGKFFLFTIISSCSLFFKDSDSSFSCSDMENLSKTNYFMYICEK